MKIFEEIEKTLEKEGHQIIRSRKTIFEMTGIWINLSSDEIKKLQMSKLKDTYILNILRQIFRIQKSSLLDAYENDMYSQDLLIQFWTSDIESILILFQSYYIIDVIINFRNSDIKNLKENFKIVFCLIDELMKTNFLYNTYNIYRVKAQVGSLYKII